MSVKLSDSSLLLEEVKAESTASVLTLVLAHCLHLRVKNHFAWGRSNTPWKSQSKRA